MKVKFKTTMLTNSHSEKEFIYDVPVDYPEQVYDDFESLYVKALKRFVVDTVDEIDSTTLNNSEIDEIIYDNDIDKDMDIMDELHALTMIVMQNYDMGYMLKSITTELN